MSEFKDLDGSLEEYFALLLSQIRAQVVRPDEREVGYWLLAVIGLMRFAL